MKYVLSLILLFGVLAGCASDDVDDRGDSTANGWLMPDDIKGNPRPEAFAADGMMFRKPMPHQEDPPKFEFYYKHCSINGDESYYSKTSYDCTGPY